MGEGNCEREVSSPRTHHSHREIDQGRGGGGEEKELTATSDLATFLISMIAAVKISVNHLRTVVNMHALNPTAPVPNYFSLRSL